MIFRERVTDMERALSSLQRDLADAHRELHTLRAKDNAAAESAAAAEARWRDVEGSLRAEIATLRADAARNVKCVRTHSHMRVQLKRCYSQMGAERKASVESESLAARVRELERQVNTTIFSRCANALRCYVAYALCAFRFLSTKILLKL
jgi:chromosome segregation ATPase